MRLEEKREKGEGSNRKEKRVDKKRRDGRERIAA